MFKTYAGKLFRAAVVVVQYGCVAHCCVEYVADFVVCSGDSMQPTINSNDVVITEHISVLRNRISVNDVIICKSPTNPQSYLCKRVHGVERDLVMHGSSQNKFSKYVPLGHVWLEGDNKDISIDSRTYGPVPYGLLRGRVIFKIWPPSDFGWIRSQSK